MKTYEQIIDGQRYWYFYDRSIRSWTVLKVDSEGNQTAPADYHAHKKNLLKNYPFNFKTLTHGHQTS